MLFISLLLRDKEIQQTLTDNQKQLHLYFIFLLFYILVYN